MVKKKSGTLVWWIAIICVILTSAILFSMKSANGNLCDPIFKEELGTEYRELNFTYVGQMHKLTKHEWHIVFSGILTTTENTHWIMTGVYGKGSYGALTWEIIITEEVDTFAYADAVCLSSSDEIWFEVVQLSHSSPYITIRRIE